MVRKTNSSAAPPKPKRKTPSPSLAPPAVLALDRHGIVKDADPRNVQRARDLLEAIERRKKRITEDFYDLGQALIELRDRELFRKVYGFSNFDEFLAERGIYAPTQARKLMTIAAGMSKPRALKLGVEKAFAAIALVAATPEPDTAEKVFAKGRKVLGKRPAEASTRDFLEEARLVRKKSRADKKVIPVMTEARRERLATRAAALKLLRETVGAIGVKKSAIHEREDDVAIILTWPQLDKLARKKPAKSRRAKR